MIGDNQTEEERAEAKEWLDENYKYFIKCTNNFFRYEKWRAYRAIAYRDGIGLAYETAIRYYHQYKPGPRSRRAYLYRIVTWHLRNLINREVKPYCKKNVFAQDDGDGRYLALSDKIFITKDRNGNRRSF